MMTTTTSNSNDSTFIREKEAAQALASICLPTTTSTSPLGGGTSSLSGPIGTEKDQKGGLQEDSSLRNSNATNGLSTTTGPLESRVVEEEKSGKETPVPTQSMSSTQQQQQQEEEVAQKQNTPANGPAPMEDIVMTDFKTPAATIKEPEMGDKEKLEPEQRTEKSTVENNKQDSLAVSDIKNVDEASSVSLAPPATPAPIKTSEPISETKPALLPPATPMQTTASSAVPPPLTQMTPAPDQKSNEEALLQEQFRFCLTLLRHMKKRKDAFPFLAPVDPVLLGIPTYFDVIQNPMDISTVEKKLQEKAYKTIQEYKDDVLLIFSNCYTFNGEEAQVSVMGKSLEKHFLKELEKLPLEVKDKKKKATPRVTPSLNTPALNRPRREVPSTPKEPLMIESLIRQNRKMAPELKIAGSVIRDLMKKHYSPYNLAFLQPVDPDALGIPQYREIIKNPMDLSTIKKKLDTAVYNTVEEVVADVRLMFQNCYTFNAPGSEVYNMGKELEAVFDRKWNERPAPGELEEKEKQRRSSSQPVTSYQEFEAEISSDDDDADAQHIEMLKTQVQLLNTQLQLLTDKRAKKQKAKAAAAAAAAASASKKSKNARKSISGPSGNSSQQKAPKPLGRKRTRTELDPNQVQELTYDQKRELSENINVLTQDQLAEVLQIIRENTTIDESQGEEIELDIDSLDKTTLWKLYAFVTKHTKKNKRSKTEKAAATAAALAHIRPEFSSASGSSSGSDSDDSGSASD